MVTYGLNTINNIEGIEDICIINNEVAKMRIKSGDFDVLYSGTINGVKDQPIEFDFPESQGALKLIIKFENDKTIKESTSKIEFPASKTMKIIIINANATYGVGNTNLMLLGYVSQRKLYLNYRVYSVSELSKTLHYTFYLGEPYYAEE